MQSSTGVVLCGTLSSHPPHPHPPKWASMCASPKPVNQTTFRRVCVQAKLRYHPTHPTPTHPTPFCCSVVKVFCGRKWPHSVVTSDPMQEVLLALSVNMRFCGRKWPHFVVISDPESLTGVCGRKWPHSVVVSDPPAILYHLFVKNCDSSQTIMIVCKNDGRCFYWKNQDFHMCWGLNSQ